MSTGDILVVIGLSCTLALVCGLALYEGWIIAISVHRAHSRRRNANAPRARTRITYRRK